MQMRYSIIILAALLVGLTVTAISCSGDETSYKKSTTTSTTTMSTTPTSTTTTSTTTTSTTTTSTATNSTTSASTSSKPDETIDQPDETSTTTTSTTPASTSSKPDETIDEAEATSTTTTSKSKPSTPFDDINEADLESFAKRKPEHESLVEKVRNGDAKAKEQYERIILSMRYKEIKANKSESDTEYDVVLNFIDDYVLRLSSSMGSTPTQEPLMKLKDLLSLVNVSDKLKGRIKELGGKFDAEECGSECLGHEMGQIMTEAIGSMMGPMDDLDSDAPAGDGAATDTDSDVKETLSNKTINVDGKSNATDEASARSEL